MKICYLCLLAILCPLLTYSQSNYRPGQVTTNTGETIKGYINVREWERNPKTIEFKTSLTNAGITKYSPLTVKEFSVSPNFNYISYAGKLANNKNVFPDLDNGIDTTSTQDTVFLKQLVSGPKATLYLFQAKQKTNFFYAEAGGAPVELIYYQYYTSTTSTRSVTTYLSQLYELAKKYSADGTADIPIVQKVSFKQSDLAKYFLKLNNVKEGKGENLSKTRYFVGAGVSFGETRFFGDTRFTKTGNVSTVAPKISGGVDIFSNPVTQRIVFRGELSLSRNSPRIMAEKPGYLLNDDAQYYEIEQLTAAVTPQAIFNLYSKPNFKYYIGAGMNINLSTYPKNRLFTENENPYYSRVIYRMQKLWLNFQFQTGVVIHKQFEASVGYAPPADYTQYPFLGVQTKSWNIGLRYHFKAF